MYDAIYIPGGKESIEALKKQGDAIHFINEAFKHCKTIGATNEGVELIAASSIKGVKASESGKGGLINDLGVVTHGKVSGYDDFNEAFVKSIAQHRHWMRAEKSSVPA